MHIINPYKETVYDILTRYSATLSWSAALYHADSQIVLVGTLSALLDTLQTVVM